MLLVRRLWCAAGLSALLLASSNANAQPDASSTPVIRFTLPPLTVTAQKEPADPQTLPVSVTAVPQGTLEEAAVRSVSDAAGYAPNTYFNEFTVRKLSNARFRGVGAGPTNPGVASYIDGVPQLNANSSSVELIDVEQIEFVRGPQSALFGRNALGGVINITSARPSLTKWSGGLSGPYGNFSTGDLRGAASGPIVANTLAASVGFGYSTREGFTKNDLTGKRPRLAVRRLRQGTTAVEGERPLGGARDVQRRARPRLATTHSTTWRRCARTRSTCRATSRGSPTATSSRRPSRSPTWARASISRRRPVSSSGRRRI
jgi:outer membrane receptor protein involved in Fe transport